MHWRPCTLKSNLHKLFFSFTFMQAATNIYMRLCNRCLDYIQGGLFIWQNKAHIDMQRWWMEAALKAKWRHAECRAQWLKPRSCSPVKGSWIITMENRRRHWITEFFSLLPASIWPDQSGSSKGREAGPTFGGYVLGKAFDGGPVSDDVAWGCSLIRTGLENLLLLNIFLHQTCSMLNQSSS